MRDRIVSVLALSVVLAAPAMAWQVVGVGLPPPPPVENTANASWKQLDNERARADSSVTGGKTVTAEDYALRPTLNYVSGLPTLSVRPEKLMEWRTKRIEHLISKNKKQLERSADGNAVVRGRVLLVDPTDAQVAAAAQAGMKIEDDYRSPALGIRMVALSARGQSADSALKRVASLGATAELDVIYEPAGSTLDPMPGAALAGAQAAAAAGGPLTIAMIDGGVGGHGSLDGATIVKKSFAGKGEPTGHGTAIASLLVGSQGPFKGSAVGARLLAADIYGGDPANGSASNMVKAIGWAAEQQASVVAISLVGPPSVAVERAIAAGQKRGMKFVAAVGNDGPLAPAAYPASINGVVSVSGVDRSMTALLEAGKAGHVDFAAPGADLVAAVPGVGYMAVRGTSFAVPLVAGRLATTGSFARLSAEAKPGKGEVGLGVVCGSCGLDPQLLAQPKKTPAS